MSTPIEPSAAMPTHFDRTLGALDGLPDCVKTKETIVRVMPFMGVGGSQMFVVHTHRQSLREGSGAKERTVSRDTIFLEHVSEAGTIRLVIPPEVAAVIHRQYDALSGKSRSKAAKALAQDRKAKGLQPAFLKMAGQKRHR